VAATINLFCRYYPSVANGSLEMRHRIIHLLSVAKYMSTFSNRFAIAALVLSAISPNDTKAQTLSGEPELGDVRAKGYSVILATTDEVEHVPAEKTPQRHQGYRFLLRIEDFIYSGRYKEEKVKIKVPFHASILPEYMFKNGTKVLVYLHKQESRWKIAPGNASFRVL